MDDTAQRSSDLKALLDTLKSFPSIVHETQYIGDYEEMIREAQRILIPTALIATDGALPLIVPDNAGRCWESISVVMRREYDQIVAFLEARGLTYGESELTGTQVRRTLRMMRLHLQYLGQTSHLSLAGTVQSSK